MCFRRAIRTEQNDSARIACMEASEYLSTSQFARPTVNTGDRGGISGNAAPKNRLVQRER